MTAPSADPLEMSRQALSSIDGTTAVSVVTSRYVAGRAAYVLRLVPRSTRTLVGAVEISIDAARRVPLRIAIFARHATKPAVSIGFTSVRFGKVDASVYRFTPPKGAAIRTVQTASGQHRDAAGTVSPATRPPDATGGLRTFGSGWEEIAAFPMPAATPNGNRSLLQVEKLLPYAGPLFSVDLVNRSGHRWIVAGMVPVVDLAAVESQLP